MNKKLKSLFRTQKKTMLFKIGTDKEIILFRELIKPLQARPTLFLKVEPSQK